MTVFSGLIPGSKKQKFPVSTSKAPYNVYAESLINCSRGFPLWKPGPPQLSHGILLDHVSIAHVGYIHEGRFKLLFDAGEDVGSRQRGVDIPDDFSFNPRFAEQRAHPVLPEEPRSMSPEFWGFKENTGIKGSASISGFAGVPGLSSASASLVLQTAQEQGAILKTRDQTHVLNATAPDIFKEYMRKNYRSWVQFGKDNYHSVDYDNLVFVTGVDLTSSCDMLAYQKSSNDMSASFSLDATAFGSASLSAWKDRQQPEWSWTSSGSDDYLSSLAPPAPSGPLISIDGSANSLPRQCIFLRGWRLGFLRAPKKIEGGAGPDDAGSPPSPSEPDPSLELEEGVVISNAEAKIDVEAEIVPIPESPPFVDPLQPLFDYVFERSNATVALVHDAQYQTLLATRRQAVQNKQPEQLEEELAIREVMNSMQVQVLVGDGVGTLSLALFQSGSGVGRDAAHSNEEEARHEPKPKGGGGGRPIRPTGGRTAPRHPKV